MARRSCSSAIQLSQTFNRDLTQEEWDRFQSVAVRVQELRVTSDSNWDNSTWIILSRWCPRGPLCPRLKRLMNFHISSYVSGPAKVMLMSPNLQHFQLSMRALEKSPPESSDLILLELQPVFHSVQSLSIDLQSAKDELPRAVEFWTFTQLHSLKIVHKLKLTPEIIHPLTAFPRLRSLDLHIQELDFGESEEEDSTSKLDLSNGFAELRALGLGGTLSDMSAFLEATTPTDLESISITISQDIVDALSSDERRQALNVVYSKFPDTLHRVSLAVENGSISNSDLIPAASDLVQPLHRLPDLRYFAFRADIYVALTDDSLRALTGLWPHLVSFEWTYAKRTLERMDENKITIAWADGAIPTVPTLIAFAQGHPELRRLTLPYVDLGSVPPLAEVPTLGHELELLVIHYLRPKVPLHHLGLALDRLFPDLDLPENLTNARRRGDELDAFLFALQSGRRGMHRA